MMHLLDARLKAALCFAALIGSAAALKADNIAYAGSSTGEFGLMDLNTGVFTSLGNSGQTLAGLAVANGSIFATSYHTTNGTLFHVTRRMELLRALGPRRA